MSEGDRRRRIFLSPPHLSGRELDYIREALESNYIAPVGPQLEAFEEEFCETVGVSHALALSSGTSGLHLAMRYLGVGHGDLVFCSTLTFVGSVNPVLYLGAVPVFIDSEEISWNMDPGLLEEALEDAWRRGALPKAVVVVHIYGQAADMNAIKDVCSRYEVPLIEDAAEALGTHYNGVHVGTFGDAAIFSFNGNKIITTSGGGMLVSGDADLVDKCRFWATQARDPAPHYEHSEMGYNYRMSNILAAIGRAQLAVLEERIAGKRDIFRFYREALSDLPGLEFMPEAPWGGHTRWLTVALIDSAAGAVNRDDVLRALERANIEARPVWKPMHLQPLFRHCKVFGGAISERIFQDGICLPSGTAMEEDTLTMIADVIRSCWDGR